MAAFVQAPRPDKFEPLGENGVMGYWTTNRLRLFLKANECDPTTWEDSFIPAKMLTNGIEWVASPATGWDRGLKNGLKTFLNKVGENAGKPKAFALGREWDEQGMKALCLFLNKNGASLKLSDGCGSCGDDKYDHLWNRTFSAMPCNTTKALQHFLNTKAFKSA